jgi:hypothetical protein
MVMSTGSAAINNGANTSNNKLLLSLSLFKNPHRYVSHTIFLAAGRAGRSFASVTWPLLAPFAYPDRAMVSSCKYYIVFDGDEWKLYKKLLAVCICVDIYDLPFTAFTTHGSGDRQTPSISSSATKCN